MEVMGLLGACFVNCMMEGCAALGEEGLAVAMAAVARGEAGAVGVEVLATL